MNPRILKEAEKYRSSVYAVAQTIGKFKPSLIAGLICEESHFGLILKPRGPAGVGDNGHGHGLMQIDDRWWEFARTGNWQDPMENIFFGVNYLKGLYDALKADSRVPEALLLPGALAAYNCGLKNVLKAITRGWDVDYFTSKDENSGLRGDYSKDVLKNAQYFIDNGWT